MTLNAWASEEWPAREQVHNEGTGPSVLAEALSQRGRPLARRLSPCRLALARGQAIYLKLMSRDATRETKPRLTAHREHCLAVAPELPSRTDKACTAQITADQVNALPSRGPSGLGQGGGQRCRETKLACQTTHQRRADANRGEALSLSRIQPTTRLTVQVKSVCCSYSQTLVLLNNGGKYPLTAPGRSQNVCPSASHGTAPGVHTMFAPRPFKE